MRVLSTSILNAAYLNNLQDSIDFVELEMKQVKKTIIYGRPTPARYAKLFLIKAHLERLQEIINVEKG